MWSCNLQDKTLDCLDKGNVCPARLLVEVKSKMEREEGGCSAGQRGAMMIDLRGKRECAWCADAGRDFWAGIRTCNRSPTVATPRVSLIAGNFHPRKSSFIVDTPTRNWIAESWFYQCGHIGFLSQYRELAKFLIEFESLVLFLLAIQLRTNPSKRHPANHFVLLSCHDFVWP